MKNKKFLPLVILVGVVALLGILLAVLTLHGEAETDTTLPLCDLAVLYSVCRQRQIKRHRKHLMLI